jgi:flagellar biosynthesis protein FliR
MDSSHLQMLVSAVLFAGARVSGLMMFAPFLGSPALPVPLKAALTLAFTIVLYPAYALHLQSGAWSCLTLIGEIMIGLVLGLTLQFLFDAAQLAGQILGVQTGFSLVTILDPQTQADTPVLALLNQTIVLLVFLQLNVHHWMLRALAGSFTYLPAGSLHISANWSGELLHAAAGIWLTGLRMATPVMVATLTADVALGFLARAAPQLPVLFMGLSIKSILGLSVLAGALALWPRLFEQQFAEGLALGGKFLLGLR